MVLLISFFLLRIKDFTTLIEYQHWNLKLQRVFSPLNLIFNSEFKKNKCWNTFYPLLSGALYEVVQNYINQVRRVTPVSFEKNTLKFGY